MSKMSELSQVLDEMIACGEGMIKAAEEGMLNFLGDKYTTILSDSDYSSMMDGLKDEYEGIGITIEGNIIRDVTANSPAEKAGLQSGDSGERQKGNNGFGGNLPGLRRGDYGTGGQI